MVKPADQRELGREEGIEAGKQTGRRGVSEGSRDSCGNHSNLKISDTHTHYPRWVSRGGGGSGVKNPGNVKLPIAVICFNPPTHHGGMQYIIILSDHTANVHGEAG